MALTILNSELTEKINDYLETLQNSNRSFLIGAGCSKCANLPLTSQLTNHIKANLEIIETKDSYGKTNSILNSVINNFPVDPNITIEEYISELVDFAAILERRKDKGSDNPTIGLGLEEIKFTEDDLKTAVIEIQQLIVKIIGDIDFTLQYHNNFIKAIHERLDNGRNLFLSPTNYFVLNYDTLIEDALSMNKINYADGFRGGAIGWWDPSVYDDSNNKARLFKLHGSLDWRNSNEDNMPRRLKDKSMHKAYNLGENVLIYPCATKYKETQNDPFALLLNHYRRLIKNEPKTVLSICGYRFADNHINVEIEKALKEGKNLTVIIFTDSDSPNNNKVLKRWYNDQEIRPHLKFFTKKGFFHNDITILENNSNDIDWWKFEVLTELLNN